MTITTSAYPGHTANMPVAPAAQPKPGRRATSPDPDPAASPPPATPVPITTARCADQSGGLDWVPDRERAIVPDAMTSLCRRCLGREACLLWAVALDAEGYWAGSTTSDRKQMQSDGAVSVRRVDQIQTRRRDRATAIARHEPGDGSYRWYRHGCRCLECRSANTAQRAEERAKARATADLAA
jgi:hypothetical protein